jgi:hypothetical protein
MLSIFNDPEVVRLLTTLQVSVLPRAIDLIILFGVALLPLILIKPTFENWVAYVRTGWIVGQKKVLLEIKLPAETFKSPAAMELALNIFHDPFGDPTPKARYWEGKVPTWASLEIACIEGEIKFYVWAFDSRKALIQANLYAQFPDIAIFEVEDYARQVLYDPKKHEFWGAEIFKAKPNPYPIKTYVDYGLSKDPDEELKIDPMAPLIEGLGTLATTDRAYIQIGIRAHRKEKTIFNNDVDDPFKEEQEKELEKVMKDMMIDEKTPNALKMTDARKDIMNAINKYEDKYVFDVVIRTIYIADKDKFNKGNIGVLAGGFKQFGSTSKLNSFKPEAINFSYWYQDIGGGKVSKWKKDMFECYVKRSFFHGPYSGKDYVLKIKKKKPSILNSEELATIYHFPGSVVKTPALKRIPSKRHQAPSNLPI